MCSHASWRATTIFCLLAPEVWASAKIFFKSRLMGVVPARSWCISAWLPRDLLLLRQFVFHIRAFPPLSVDVWRAQLWQVDFCSCLNAAIIQTSAGRMSTDGKPFGVHGPLHLAAACWLRYTLQRGHIVSTIDVWNRLNCCFRCFLCHLAGGNLKGCQERGDIFNTHDKTQTWLSLPSAHTRVCLSTTCSLCCRGSQCIWYLMLPW